MSDDQAKAAELLRARTAELAIRAAKRREPMLAVGWALVGAFGAVLIEGAEVPTTPPRRAERDCGWASRVPRKRLGR